ncbi:hypothetical protein BKA03_001535 [Demequina lutea]|uniref:Uncharacterized protein n=1 Tax=Demequina lutea TaxID=431489 RepID=A0A7Z0CHE9_9MICO|nr:hypothetical protein [Demequina lutea]
MDLMKVLAAGVAVFDLMIWLVSHVLAAMSRKYGA